VGWVDAAMPDEALAKLNHSAIRTLELKAVLKVSRLPSSADKPTLKRSIIENWSNVSQGAFHPEFDARILSKTSKNQ